MKKFSTLEALEARIAPATFDLGTGVTAVGNTALTAADEVSAFVNDFEGSGRFDVTGTFSVDGTALTIFVSGRPTNGQQFVLVQNDGTDPIGGEGFAGLPEGTQFRQDNRLFTISYEGGDGNDVVLTAVVPQAQISANGKVATFIDEDGDRVTLKTNKGAWTQEMFDLIGTGDIRGGAHLQLLDLGTALAGAKITITSKPDLFGGNGFVNITEISAASSEIASISVDGDVGRLDLGASGSVKPVKSVVVHSLGQLGESNRPFGTFVAEITSGRPLNSVTIKTDMVDGSVNAPILKKLTVGGSVLGNSLIEAESIGSIAIGRDLAGNGPSEKVVIKAFGATQSPAKGVDTAIQSIMVGGRVSWAFIEAGIGVNGKNADASIGKVAVGGDWIASTLVAGTSPGVDGLYGTGDDVRHNELGTRDQANLIATIGSIVIKGQAIGTAGNDTDNFGIVSEFIKKAKIGPVKIPLVGTPRTPDDRFFLASTGPGGDGSLSDVALLETVA